MPQCWLRALCFIFSPGSLHYRDVYRRESGRCCTLSFFLTFCLSIHLSRFSFYINVVLESLTSSSIFPSRWELFLIIVRITGIKRGQLLPVSMFSVFRDIHTMLIDTDLCECQNMIINFSRALLFVSLIWRPLHFPCNNFLVSHFWVFLMIKKN